MNATTPAPARGPRYGSVGLLALAAAGVAILYTATDLAAVASLGRFAYDECFHAYVAEWIATHGAIPKEFPNLYGGFYYYYQPLLHLIGAVAFALFGRVGLHVLPAVFWAATGAVLLWGARRVVPAEARAWAAGLFVLNASLVVFGMQLYVEGLTSLVFTAAAVAWVGWRAASGARTTAVLGVMLGLGLLTKFAGWMPVLAVAAVAIVLTATGRRAQAMQLAGAAGLAVLIVLPWLVRNQLLFGSALYPAFAPDLDRAFYELNRARNTMPASALFARLPGVLGTPLVTLTVVCLVAAAARRRWVIGMDLVVAALLGVLATAFTPMAAPRHVLPFLPMLALGGAWVLYDALAGKRALSLAVGALVLGSAIVAAATRDDPRRAPGLPAPVTEAITAVARLVPERSHVLSLWTYDTFYHSGRAATWPNPWGQRRRPLELFTERDPARLAGLLRRDSIDFVLAPIGVPPASFDSGNYPASLLAGLDSLMRAGEVEPVWSSRRLVLLRVAPAPSARE
jgi:hypothetical protein